MMWWGEFYGVLTFGVVALAWMTSKRHPDAFGLSVMLLIAWALTNLMDAMWEPPESKVFNTVTDVTIGLMAVWAWQSRKAPWKIALALLFGVQSIAHVVYQGWFWADALNVGFTTYRYEAFLNATFALQLGCVAWPGGRDVVRLVSRLRLRAVEGDHLGASP